MNLDESTQALESTPEARSRESKPKHVGRGGRRPGAGRKPDLAKRLLSGIKAITAAELLSKIDTEAVVNDLLKKGSRQLKWQVITVLWDRVYGKPKQDVSVSGGIVHAHTVYRNPILASLSLEELAQLDALTKKLAAPVQDGPHNQTQSESATNTIDIECESIETVQVPENAPNNETKHGV